MTPLNSSTELYFLESLEAYDRFKHAVAMRLNQFHDRLYSGNVYIPVKKLTKTNIAEIRQISNDTVRVIFCFDDGILREHTIPLCMFEHDIEIAYAKFDNWLMNQND